MGLLFTMGLTTSCSNSDWEDNLSDVVNQGGNNGKTSVYFAMQAPIRTITLGNDDDADNTDDNLHQFKLKATLGGVYKNTIDRKLSYIVDPSLLEGSGMEVLPASYYSFEDASTLTIPAGEIIGGTTVKLTEAFFNDPKAATNHYVLPVRITSSQTNDSIIQEKAYQLLCVKYKNQYTGLYCKTGTSNVQGGRSISYKNEDDLDVVSTVDMNTCQLSYTFPVKEWANDLQIDVTKTVVITLSFSGDNCRVLQDGKEIGTGTFTARGIQDFSDSKRMADCLKLKFSASIVTNAGEADHQKTWTVDCDYVMSMMSRNNKLESWQ